MELSISLNRLARFTSSQNIKGGIEDRAAKEHYARLLDCIRQGEELFAQRGLDARFVEI